MLYVYVNDNECIYKSEKSYNFITKEYTYEELQMMIINECNKSFTNFVMFFNDGNYMSLLRELLTLSKKFNSNIYIIVK